MLIERFEATGLAHLSYLVGDGGLAAVIDPRRDCQVYVDRAASAGQRIAFILETHRNEDYVVGSRELAARTGAEIWHAEAVPGHEPLNYQYGQAVEDGQTWRIGRLLLEALHTPGHTPGSMSYLLREPGGAPWMVFTGDALFAGDVGRVDLLGMDRAAELAGWLYDSIFQRLLPLGDHVLIWPAHGSGSVCGSAIDERPWTTIGLERRLNPHLQVSSRDEFVAGVAREMERPPYFRRMERLNLEGAPLLGRLPAPPPLSPEEVAARMDECTIVDTRGELSFGAAHVPGSLSIGQGSLASYAGWFLPYGRPILLVTEDDDPGPAVRTLVRLGYEDGGPEHAGNGGGLAGYLSGGMHAWHTAGRESRSVGMVTVEELCRRTFRPQDGPRPWILDVRSAGELETAGRIEGAHHIHLTQLPGEVDRVPKDRPVYIFCGSGRRSMTAASLLKRAGWQNLVVVLGGMTGWNNVKCELDVDQ
ncbi:MAG: MBL fold metallo-hydrolase [Anaerolineae bacterium]